MFATSVGIMYFSVAIECMLLCSAMKSLIVLGYRVCGVIIKRLGTIIHDRPAYHSRRSVLCASVRRQTAVQYKNVNCSSLFSNVHGRPVFCTKRCISPWVSAPFVFRPNTIHIIIITACTVVLIFIKLIVICTVHSGQPLHQHSCIILARHHQVIMACVMDISAVIFCIITVCIIAHHHQGIMACIADTPPLSSSASSFLHHYTHLALVHSRVYCRLNFRHHLHHHTHGLQVHHHTHSSGSSLTSLFASLRASSQVHHPVHHRGRHNHLHQNLRCI